MEQQETLINFETAKLAKEKGFNIYQNHQYGQSGAIYYYSLYQCKLFGDVYYAPSQSLLQKWLRDKCKLHIEIQLGKDDYQIFYNYRIDKIEFVKNYVTDYLSLNEIHNGVSNYEECLEMGLQNALKLL